MNAVCSVSTSQSILTLVSSGRLLTWKYTAPGCPVRKWSTLSKMSSYMLPLFTIIHEHTYICNTIGRLIFDDKKFRGFRGNLQNLENMYPQKRLAPTISIILIICILENLSIKIFV